MMRASTLAALICLGLPTPSQAHGEDDPLLAMVSIDKLEWRQRDADNAAVWDLDAWIGRDRNKLWLRSEGEYADGRSENAWAEALYGRALAPFWDLQLGWRHDFRPQPGRDWLAVGVKGLAPYWFDVEATLYAGGNGTVAGRFDSAYELLFTQRLILEPELELDFYGKDDGRRGIGSGLSNLEMSLRLRYQIRRELAPYVGVSWERALGQTADYAREEGKGASDLQYLAGVRAWF